jgi:hypothetical protein
VLFHDLDVHRKGYLTVHDFLAAVDTQAKREELESIFLALPISFPIDHQVVPTLSLSTSLSYSSVPTEVSLRRSFSEQPPPSDPLHLPPVNPALSSSTSSSKLSSIFKFLAPSKSTVSQMASVDRSHSGDDRTSGSASGSSAGCVDRDEYERDVMLTYNDFIAAFLCHQSVPSSLSCRLVRSLCLSLADHLDRALVVFRYLDSGPPPSPSSTLCHLLTVLQPRATPSRSPPS